MNKQIKELWTRVCQDEMPELDETCMTLQRQHKFAKLIVEECMSMCDETRAGYFGHRIASDDFIDKNLYAEGEAASEVIRFKMKKRFEVE